MTTEYATLHAAYVCNCPSPVVVITLDDIEYRECPICVKGEWVERPEVRNES